MNILNLQVPRHPVDVVLDTDAYNEIDDQFAISYLLLSKDKLNTKAIYAAPFSNSRSEGPRDGMEKSYDEIITLLKLMKREDLVCNVYKGSQNYLENERTPVLSPAASDLCQRAMEYTPENPLYVVAIGAITNIASALLQNPQISERIVIVWLGGHSHEMPDTKEFNMVQDIAAARIVMQSGAPFVQLPCNGIVSEFRISKPELEYWLCGKNPLADYLASATINEADGYAKGKPWTRVIWDVTAVGWLLNDEDKFMKQRVTDTYVPNYDGIYEKTGQVSAYVYSIKRDRLMQDLIQKLTQDNL